MCRILICIALLVAYAAPALEPVPDKTVALTFDDAVKSHRTFVGPLLKDLGFGATFFVTALWMSDTDNFMTWQEIAELNQMGFEIGNHSWSHSNFGTPKYAAHLEGQLFLVEQELAKVGVPKPTSFGWCGNTFGPEGVDILKKNGYTLARRGMQPEIPYGQIKPGPLFDPAAYNPLLLPSAGDAYPQWTLDDFKRVVDRAKDGKIAIVQFHGVPDVAHPWVHTDPERFRSYMNYLKQNGFNVIALRDIQKYVDVSQPPNDAMTMVHYAPQPMDLGTEIGATRADAPFWLDNMINRHHYSLDEAAAVLGVPAKTLESRKAGIEQNYSPWPESPPRGAVLALPYPGGRHPRIGFLDGAVEPKRGTKASIFAPWDPASYAVIDLPEAIFSNLGLMFLAHTHVISLWDKQHQFIENVDWKRLPNGELVNEWILPDKVRFGARITPRRNAADLELWLENGSAETLTGLRTQICVMLKGMNGFAAQSNDNKRFEDSVAAVRAEDGKHWLLVAFDRCGRTWGNAKCPCMHSDPDLPDAAPGQRVSVKGRYWFYEGENVDKEIARAQKEFKALPKPRSASK